MRIMNKTALYVRVSTKDQLLQTQEDELKRVCDVMGWTDYEIYSEKISAVKVRPEFERMLANARRGLLARIVCYKLDRIGRSLSHLALVIDELSKLKVPLVCTSQGIDTTANNPAGKLQLGVLMAVAEFEREIIRERVALGLAAAKRRGVRLGREPFDPAIIPEVQALRQSGHTLRYIASTLHVSVGTVHKIISA